MNDRVQRLKVLAEDASVCESCGLHGSRTKSVFARGNPQADLVFIGEAPGQNEDEQGIPFIGAAGQLLDKMIAGMGLQRDDVYVCNAVKCRPPENRTPTLEEIATCYGFLHTQLDIVRPRVIITLGKTATISLLCVDRHRKKDAVLTNWRGKWRDWCGTPVMPTYHPSYLLRDPSQKVVVGRDLRKVLNKLKELR